MEKKLNNDQKIEIIDFDKKEKQSDTRKTNVKDKDKAEATPTPKVSNLVIKKRLLAYLIVIGMIGGAAATFFQIKKNTPKTFNNITASDTLDKLKEHTMLDEVLESLNAEELEEKISIESIDRIETLINLSERLNNLKLDEYTEGLVDIELSKDYTLEEIETIIEEFEKSSANIDDPNTLNSQSRALIDDALLLEACGRAIEYELYYESYDKLAVIAETILKTKIGEACELSAEETNSLVVEKDADGLVTGNYYFEDTNGKKYTLNYCFGAMIYSQKGYGSTLESKTNEIISTAKTIEQEKKENEQNNAVNVSALEHNSKRNNKLSEYCSTLKTAIASKFTNKNNTIRCIGFNEINEELIKTK